MSNATASAKRCVNCNKDVSTEKRMKDSSGKYWCLKCGEADQAKKGQAQTGTPCADCDERYPAAKLTRYGASRICPTCYKARMKGPGLKASLRSGGGDGGTDKARLVKMIAAMGVLLLVSMCHFVFHLY
jgi:hypothetical protein